MECRYEIRVGKQTKDNLTDFMGRKGDAYKANLKRLLMKKYLYIMPANKRVDLSHQELIYFLQCVYNPKEINNYRNSLLLSNDEVLQLTKGELYQM